MTSNELLESFRRALIDAVMKAGPMKGLRGTNARDVLGKDFTPVDFGCRNLRQFIQEQVPSLKIIGSSGGDVVWGLTDWSPLPTRAHTEQRVSDPRQDSLWRIWVSPLSHQVIVVNLETSEFRGAPSDEPIEECFVRIEPLNMLAHRNIAQAFVDAGHIQDPAMRASLASAIGNSDGDWWKQWNQILHTDHTSFHVWRRYRVEELRRQLRERLEALGISQYMAEKIETAVMASSQRPSDRNESSVASDRKFCIARNGSHREVSLRDLVTEVVARMSEDQLRGLTLPAGLLADAFARLVPSSRHPRGN